MADRLPDFGKNPPTQEKFQREGEEIETTARPVKQYAPGLTEIPQRKNAYGEFIRDSHTEGNKSER